MTPGAAEEHASVNQNAIWRVINVYREKEDVDRPQPEGLQCIHRRHIAHPRGTWCGSSGGHTAARAGKVQALYIRISSVDWETWTPSGLGDDTLKSVLEEKHRRPVSDVVIPSSNRLDKLMRRFH
ncbi:hypothetical protein T310_2905 [Rasamsonia emersonii CBS 393.64]|uniref:Uncharacterized protein n=1 Tax=Rasamsonia emersonii (strain ATCC 16479 / CBS 393.64 / IMI 116815) TaxID=1408163 RepID=A0A0F4YYV9_RASE3|nr:hypothetical protein T310_2905 [Rasamsonia emersonii CBS 393.64]KKA23026.1 hypothetical protein T310_2905 [Rasamsonia emersonii CBS 393.64]